jgi:hypothetical protein
MQLAMKLAQLNQYDRDYILDRVHYYNKLDKPFELPVSESTCIKDFKKTKGWTYFFDLWSVLRYFPKQSRFCYLNGDITYVPNHPSFVKSRPIGNDNQNAVLLKLNKIRHFLFVNDPVPYQEKKDMVVWRGAGYKNHRRRIIERFYDHPKCNIGQVVPIKGNPWEKEFLSIREQLNYKFILCIEGNDVATNLKWAMSSNSVCIMSKPKFETWFMEGRLKAGVHYVEVKADYSDLVEKVEYYLKNEDKAMSVISNANKYVTQFEDIERERILGLLVANNYLKIQTTH